MALGIRESITLFLIGLDTTISHEQDETDSYTNVSFLGHELWPIQENGDIRKCCCSRMDVSIALTRICILLQRAKPATKREMTQFHSDEYVDFLSRITPSNMNSYIKEQHKCRWFLLTSLAPLTFYRR